MSAYPLRPVPAPSPTPSPTPSDPLPRQPTPRSASTLMPPILHPQGARSTPVGQGSSRPWTPPPLNDVDLSSNADSGRRYPAPPTGHDLMALFPPQSPSILQEPAAGMTTSGWFERQERAFFARAGKEIVRMDKAAPHSPGKGDSPGRDGVFADKNNAPQPWPRRQTGGAAPPHPYPPLNTRVPRAQGAASALGHPATSPLVLPVSPQWSPMDRTPHPHAARCHPHVLGTSPSSTLKSDSPAEDWRDDPDEAWRRPMPHNERRRAGKHTKRVIVRT